MKIDDDEQRLQTELAIYDRLLKGRTAQAVPGVWDKVEAHVGDEMERVCGVRTLYQYVARHVGQGKRVSILGIGSGSCGNELDGIAPLLLKQGCQIELTCIDIDSELLKQGQEAAEKMGIPFCGRELDANTMELEPDRYDVVVAYTVLHHFVNLDYIAAEINKCLRKDGIFVTVDIPTRNGYLMWDETCEIVNTLWKLLPPRFKIDHTRYEVPTYADTYENINYSVGSFECINSEAIIPALRSRMTELHFVPALAFARRFLDTKFGPNYSLDNTLDCSILDFILKLDSYCISSGLLKPETFFGAYAKKGASGDQSRGISPAYSQGLLSFRCNICGDVSTARLDHLSRESESCANCGSTVRRRSVIDALSQELFGQSLALPDFPTRSDIRGLGLSDWDGYAIGLARKFNYTNTYFHQEPRLDITSPNLGLEGRFDFIICSEVFEHIAPPVSAGFQNLRRLLKPSGVLIFTVPYGRDGETIEQFPDLWDYQIVQQENAPPVLRNTKKDGAVQVYKDLVFHDGGGMALQMRCFSRASLLREFRRVGLSKIKFYGAPKLELGIYWLEGWSLPMSVRVESGE
ncbi:MAG: class I SAM-dependent methyltransferase [Chloroflexi bacterium]|nr:class I SAM-dependent methyltransferase [Chloroflexota bacterium]